MATRGGTRWRGRSAIGGGGATANGGYLPSGWPIASHRQTVMERQTSEGESGSFRE